jgi:hypothetical protein
MEDVGADEDQNEVEELIQKRIKQGSGRDYE